MDLKGGDGMAKKYDSYDNTHEAVRGTARRLFSANGVRATSLADIAAAAKVSKGTLYYYYPTKEYLVLDIAEEHFALLTERVFQWLDGIHAGTPDSALVTALYEALMADTDTARLHFVLLCEAICGNEELRARFDAKYSEWIVVMEMGALRAQTTTGLHRKSKLLFAALDGCAVHALLGRDIPFTQLGTLFSENSSS
jgi:AcrR family transcriptional regulator